MTSGAIIRPVVSREYVSIPNAILADRRLSIETRGMLCFILSKSKNFEIRPWALANALSTEGKRLGRTKLDRMIAEAMRVGYIARSDKQGRKAHGKFGRFAYIVGLPEDVIAELQRQSVAILPQTQNPHTDDPHTDDPHTGFGSALSTKIQNLPIKQSTNHHHHQSGHPAPAVYGERPKAAEERYSAMGQHALANGMTFVWIGSEPYRAWHRLRGPDGMPFVDVAILDGVERRGCWMPSMYPRQRARA
jgi:hypothetical protein